MSTARDYLAAVQQRADAATNGPWERSRWEPGHTSTVFAPGLTDGPHAFPVAERVVGRDANFIAASRTDVPRLVAALTAALDLADEYEYVGDTDLRAVITDALTPKENDS